MAKRRVDSGNVQPGQVKPFPGSVREPDGHPKRPMATQNQAVQATPVAAEKKIGPKQIRKASQILRKYKEGKRRLEEKIIANEEFWKLRQWNYMTGENKKDFKPATAWLWSCIQGRYSDVMDSYPTCNIQPRQRDDVDEAKILSQIIPVVMEQNRYEETYSDIAWYALKQGGCIQGVFWDQSKHNGLGDISIKKVDFINLFWEPGITNIQQSANLFVTELVSNEILQQRYPQTIGKLGGKRVTLAKYLYDDNVDTSDKSVVVEWYYHTEYNGKRVLQYVKYVNDEVLYATENETERPTKTVTDPVTGAVMTVNTGASMAERGLYDHGMYPFVSMALYPIEGSLCGYGLTDIGRDTQFQIDKLNKAIVDNAVVGSKPRYFVNSSSGLNEEEFSDVNKDLVHIDGTIDEMRVKVVDYKPLDGNYVTFLNNKIDELKFITSNQDANNGTAPSGVTAASAIAALQETAGKNARSSNKVFHRAYREVVYLVIELIRQFYTLPRTFRICPDGAGEQFIQYTNKGLVPQRQKSYGQDMGFRLPEFDIDVTSEKANPYKKMEINELALSFYNAGFFNPQLADQAVACLEMMDFTQKDKVIDRVKTNGTLQQLVLQYQSLALQLAQRCDPMLAEQLAQTILQQGGGQPMPNPVVDTEIHNGEHPYVERARDDARSSTQAD